jgi:hypothetical protein
MAASASMAPANTYKYITNKNKIPSLPLYVQYRTCCREFFIAMTAAMKNVLSPISDAKITPHDFRNPSRNCVIMIEL